MTVEPIACGSFSVDADVGLARRRRRKGNRRAWVERAVIGLNLRPFAGAAWRRNQIRYVVGNATGADDLLGTLSEELGLLASADPAQA